METFKIDLNVHGHNGGQVLRSGFVSQFWNKCLFEIDPVGIFAKPIISIVEALNDGKEVVVILKNVKQKHEGASGRGCAKPKKGKHGKLSWRLNNTGTNLAYSHKAIPIKIKVLGQMDMELQFQVKPSEFATYQEFVENLDWINDTAQGQIKLDGFGASPGLFWQMNYPLIRFLIKKKGNVCLRNISHISAMKATNPEDGDDIFFPAPNSLFTQQFILKLNCLFGFKIFMKIEPKQVVFSKLTEDSNWNKKCVFYGRNCTKYPVTLESIYTNPNYEEYCVEQLIPYYLAFGPPPAKKQKKQIKLVIDKTDLFSEHLKSLESIFPDQIQITQDEQANKTFVILRMQ